MIHEISCHHQQKDNVGYQICNHIREKRETRRRQLIDERIDVGEIRIAHGLIVNRHYHFHNLELKPLRHFRHHAVFEPAVPVVQGNVENRHEEKVTEKRKRLLRLLFLQVLDDIRR
jgi:hypothetical protein